MKIKIAVAMVCLLIVLIFIGFFLSKPKVYAVSRVLLKVDINHRQTNADGYLVQFQEISDFLDSTNTKVTLALFSHAKANSFQCVQVKPLRSTQIVWLEYRGSESNIVWNVASNAAYLVETQYATNQIGTSIERIDTEFWQPPSAWSRFMDRLSGLFQ